MINTAFETVHLQQRKIVTSLFNHAKEAFIGQAYGHRFHAKCLVIESTERLQDSMFKDCNLCPIYICNGKSYIFQEGESLHSYFLAKKGHDIVLCEEEIWKLLAQISRALLKLKDHGLEHRHISQESIRRVNESVFKLIYHPSMNSIQSLIKSNKYEWYKFYLAPEQLADYNIESTNSCVFSLGAMVLNIMNPLDFKRTIYSMKQYRLNQAVVQEKISNAYLIYSKQIMEIVKKMLVEHYERRLTLEELVELIEYVSPFEKKKYMTSIIRDQVNSRLQKSRARSSRSNTPPSEKGNKAKGKPENIAKGNSTKIINFQRGTFGGDREAQPSATYEKQRSEQREEELQMTEPKQPIYTNKAQRKLNKNESEKSPKMSPQNTQRSYSEYFHATKKDKPDPSCKHSDVQTKAQTGKIKVDIQVYPGSQSKKSEQSKTYNEYIRQQQNSKKISIQLSPPNEKHNDHIKIDDGSTSRYRQSNASERREESLCFSRTQAIGSNAQPVEQQSIEASLQLFKSRVDHYHIKSAQCLDEPANIARRLGYQGVWIDGNVYYGDFYNGRRNGLALQIFQNNEYYYGHYKDDMFHGEGFYYWSPSEHFLGLFDSGMKIEGTWWGRNKYVGQIKDNKRHGIGTFIYSNGSVYQGEWFRGKRHGAAIVVDPSGQKYIGTFKEGKKYGHGTYLMNDCRISGVWDGEHPVGPIQMTFFRGRYYKGQINENYQMDGQGQLTFSNGTRCRGTFQQNKFIFGQMFYSNGEYYKGEFRDSCRHGRGSYTYLNGRVATGVWESNVLQEQF